LAKKKPSPAAKVRAALDPHPPLPVSDHSPGRRVKPLVEEARPPPVRMLSARQVMAKIGITWPTLFNWSNSGLFPLPRRIGRKIFWVEHELDQFLLNLPTKKPPAKKRSEYEEV
jgi:predicted DNA-binding transcriptional regulator AlpA